MTNQNEVIITIPGSSPRSPVLALQLPGGARIEAAQVHPTASGEEGWAAAVQQVGGGSGSCWRRRRRRPAAQAAAAGAAVVASTGATTREVSYGQLLFIIHTVYIVFHCIIQVD